MCSALFHVLESLPIQLKGRVVSLAIDGTSATTLLVDGASGEPLADPKLYNEAQSAEVVQRAKVSCWLGLGRMLYGPTAGMRTKPLLKFPSVASV